MTLKYNKVPNRNGRNGHVFLIDSGDTIQQAIKYIKRQARILKCYFFHFGSLKQNSTTLHEHWPTVYQWNCSYLQPVGGQDIKNWVDVKILYVIFYELQI